MPEIRDEVIHVPKATFFWEEALQNHVSFGIVTDTILNSSCNYLFPTEWTKVIDYSGGTSFLLFLTGMIYVPAALMWNNPLPPASGATVTMEQVK